jgi:hypothetical protein
MKNFHSSVTDLRQEFTSVVESFPYEAGWADEAIFFVTAEPQTPPGARISLSVQLSADGIRWLDEGSVIELAGPSSAFVRVAQFGDFLRLAGTVVDENEPRCILTVRLALKG